MIDDLGACVVLCCFDIPYSHCRRPLVLYSVDLGALGVDVLFCFMPFIYALLVAFSGGVFLFRERQNNSLLYHIQSAITVLRRTFGETKQNIDV